MVRKRGREGGREAVSSGGGGGRPRWTSTPAVAFGTATSDGLPRPFLLRRPFLSHADVNVIRKQSGSGRAWLSVELHQKRAVQFNSKDVTLLRQY